MQTLIVTDMDGTLLDHHDYSFDAAAEALAAIRARSIPLILASSKTRVEMLRWQQRLSLEDPFICENGAAICTPTGAGELVDELAPGREHVLQVLRTLRVEQGYSFTGFSDLDVEQIARLTGLEPGDAALAAQREYSEPLVWEGDAASLDAFRAALAEQGLRAQQGGRFLSVAGPTDKGQAVTRLRQRYGGQAGSRVIALGDSPNDESMLAVADIAVIIKSGRSADMQLDGPARVIRTDAPGPVGWQAALLPLLAEMPQ